MFAIGRTGTHGLEYFSYDKSMTSPEGGWSTDKVIALLFATERSAGDFLRRQLSYASAQVTQVNLG
jgi:uncharacterized protein (DUF1330 family)